MVFTHMGTMQTRMLTSNVLLDSPLPTVDLRSLFFRCGLRGGTAAGGRVAAGVGVVFVGVTEVWPIPGRERVGTSAFTSAQ